jgi:hypothetical protein
MRLQRPPGRIASPAVELKDTIGMSWADVMEVDDENEFRELYSQYFPEGDFEVALDPSDADAALTRPVTAANFGRPPPSVPVRHVIGNITTSVSWSQPKKLSKGARRRRNKRMQKDKIGYKSEDDRSESESDE